MVLPTVITTPVSCENSDGEEYCVSDCISEASSKDYDNQGELVLHEDDQLEPPSYGNIAINNSSDVHFGNKTFYQGPVTIKQFLYTNGSNSDGTSASNNTKLSIKDGVTLDPNDLVNGLDNPTFVADIPSLVTVKEPIPEEPGDPRFSRITKGVRWIQTFSQQHLFIIIGLLALLMVSLAILMVVLLVKHSPTQNSQKPGEEILPYVPREDTDESSISKPVRAPLDSTFNLTLPPKLKIVSRIEWVAQPASEPATKLNTPVPYVIIMHTATENCSSRAQCNFHVRYIQMFHVESNNWWDIGYNFLVGGDGNAYEGRGWESEGAHTYGYNARSIGIAFIGTFTKIKPPEIQMTACKQLIAKGVELGYISKNYKLLAARQLQTTESPGELLYKEMKNWPHWSSTP